MMNENKYMHIQAFPFLGAYMKRSQAICVVQTVQLVITPVSADRLAMYVFQYEGEKPDQNPFFHFSL